jgi:leader peptidase (prepilin peptidase)/N-methyltransferase
MTSLHPIWLALLAAPAAVWAIERGAAQVARIEPPVAPEPLRAAMPIRLAMLGLAAAVAATAAQVFAGPEAWVAAGLGWVLLALARIDLAHGLLPDVLTLPLAVAGLAVAGLQDPARLPDAALGAAAGFAALALVGWAYRRWRGRDGLGLGDAKLLGAGGAWLGAAALPLTVCLAATAALVTVLAARVTGRRFEDADQAIPFGPFLCLAVWIVFLLREGMLRA